MNRQNVFDALEFQNQHVLDDEVQTVTTVEVNALVLDRQRNLPLERNTPKV